jgi:pimeloyl-ACP methyl ester carboxylesterase
MLSIQVKEKVFNYAPLHELNEITELLTKKGLASFTASRDVPRVNDIKTTLLEVTNVARRQLGPLHFGDGRDLRIRVADRSADRAPVSGNPGKSSRCIALEPEDAPCQVLGKHGFRRFQPPLATFALGEQLSCELHLALAGRPYPKLMHYNKLDKGGHFAAWEQPQLLSEEVRAGFRSLRRLSLTRTGWLEGSCCSAVGRRLNLIRSRIWRKRENGGKRVWCSRAGNCG